LHTLLTELDQFGEDISNPLRCMACGNPITTPQERFARGGSSHFQMINPAGYRFDIALFHHALGCYPRGHASADASWFPPFNWRLAHCDQCDQHLGWFYQDGEQGSFWGLITALLSDA
jgi:hypothetical protein